MGKIVEFRVVGLTFRGNYPENLLRLAARLEEKQAAMLGWSGEAGDGEAGLPLVLRRDPDNPHDPNAIEIHAPDLGRDKTWIGFVPKEIAARWAPSLDRGDEWVARLTDIPIKPEYPRKPGAQVQAECISRAPR